MKTCTEANCNRKFYARGWCQYHYNLAITTGTLKAHPRSLVEPGSSLDTRLRHFGWTVVGTCWEWNGGLDNSGYGQLAVGEGRPEKAYRAAYRAWVGSIPTHMYVCHSCDNRRCINPAHLFLGSDLDNLNDMFLKRRHCHGERRPNYKLTDADVAEIRERYSAGGILQKELAREFGVSQQLVSELIRGARRVEPTHWITPQVRA